MIAAINEMLSSCDNNSSDFLVAPHEKMEALQGTGPMNSVPDRAAVGMSHTQELFLQWNANRLGITLEESERRYSASWSVLPWGGAQRPRATIKDAG